MSYLYVQQGMNLMVGDDGPDNSKDLILNSVEIPAMEEITATHLAGGANAEIEIGTRALKALTCSFKTTGYDPQTAVKFGIGSGDIIPYTFYADVKNKNGGANVQVKAVMRGTLTMVKPDSSERSKLLSHDHAIKEIFHYELYFGKQEIYFWDFFARIWRVNGVVQNQSTLTNLAIPTG